MADSMLINISEPEYNSILRQAVAFIDKTRAIVATTVCAAIGTANWELGKLLHDQKLESKHGSSVVNRLSLELKLRRSEMNCLTEPNCPCWIANKTTKIRKTITGTY
jgi:hypothetical protein